MYHVKLWLIYSLDLCSSPLNKSSNEELLFQVSRRPDNQTHFEFVAYIPLVNERSSDYQRQKIIICKQLTVQELITDIIFDDTNRQTLGKVLFLLRDAVAESNENLFNSSKWLNKVQD